MKVLLGGLLERKVKEVRIDRTLDFPCPVCDARRGERCRVQRGVIRFEPHSARTDLANETARLFAEERVFSFISGPKFPNGWDAA
jgi:hypothetical protein